MATPRGTDSARVIRVIETTSLRGEGTQDDLCRLVTQYWDFDGNLLADCYGLTASGNLLWGTISSSTTDDSLKRKRNLLVIIGWSHDHPIFL